MRWPYSPQTVQWAFIAPFSLPCQGFGAHRFQQCPPSMQFLLMWNILGMGGSWFGCCACLHQLSNWFTIYNSRLCNIPVNMSLNSAYLRPVWCFKVQIFFLSFQRSCSKMPVLRWSTSIRSFWNTKYRVWIDTTQNCHRLKMNRKNSALVRMESSLKRSRRLMHLCSFLLLKKVSLEQNSLKWQEITVEESSSTQDQSQIKTQNQVKCTAGLTRRTNLLVQTSNVIHGWNISASHQNCRCTWDRTRVRSSMCVRSVAKGSLTSRYETNMRESMQKRLHTSVWNWI